MKKIILVLMTLFLLAPISRLVANNVSIKSSKDKEENLINDVDCVKVILQKNKVKRSLELFPEVYINTAEYRLYVIHPQNGDMGTFRIEDPSGMIEHSDSYKADGSTNEFSLPPFLSGPYTIILECGGEEYEGEFVI